MAAPPSYALAAMDKMSILNDVTAPENARLPILTLVVAQFFGTSLWFSSNAAAVELQAMLNLSAAGIGWLTNAVQGGFIAGTLLIALTGLADRYAASRIFLTACLIGAMANALFVLAYHDYALALLLRFIVGLSLAGIYPLGMKLVITWTKGGSGATLGLLVGMLTLGTALPHGIRGLDGALPWQTAVLSSSVLAILAGLAVARLGEGPYLKRSGTRGTIRPAAVLQAFRIPAFRAAAFGYFGHMWELYAFWTLVPFLILLQPGSAASAIEVSRWSFLIIGIGAAGCFAGGLLSLRIGSARVAAIALFVSGAFCLLYPFTAAWPPGIRLLLLLVWGVAVVADSPQFSSLSGKACPPESVGSALAIQNALGFSITTVAIALSTGLLPAWGEAIVWLLLPGPVLGLLGLWPLLKQRGF